MRALLQDIMIITKAKQMTYRSGVSSHSTFRSIDHLTNYNKDREKKNEYMFVLTHLFVLSTYCFITFIIAFYSTSHINVLRHR